MTPTTDQLIEDMTERFDAAYLRAVVEALARAGNPQALAMLAAEEGEPK